MDSIVVTDEMNSVDVKTRLYPPEYEGHFSSLLISSEQIDDRVHSLAKVISRDYKGKRPILLCTLKGACPFFAHLCTGLQKQRQGFDLEFVRASSYEGTESSGSVSIVGELRLESLKDRHVLIVEDIVDTGTTLATLLPMLKDKGEPATVEVCTLLDKRLGAGVEKKYTAKYCGFSIPDSFVIGYGLDYNELYRDLEDIFVISQMGIDFDVAKLHS